MITISLMQLLALTVGLIIAGILIHAWWKARIFSRDDGPLPPDDDDIFDEGVNQELFNIYNNQTVAWVVDDTFYIAGLIGGGQSIYVCRGMSFTKNPKLTTLDTSISEISINEALEQLHRKAANGVVLNQRYDSVKATLDKLTECYQTLSALCPVYTAHMALGALINPTIVQGNVNDCLKKGLLVAVTDVCIEGSGPECPGQVVIATPEGTYATTPTQVRTVQSMFDEIDDILDGFEIRRLEAFCSNHVEFLRNEYAIGDLVDDRRN